MQQINIIELRWNNFLSYRIFSRIKLKYNLLSLSCRIDCFAILNREIKWRMVKCKRH